MSTIPVGRRSIIGIGFLAAAAIAGGTIAGAAHAADDHAQVRHGHPQVLQNVPTDDQGRTTITTDSQGNIISMEAGNAPLPKGARVVGGASTVTDQAAAN